MNIRKQGGGTLLGLMVGVLVSVLVAVAVAVYVARIPVPFVDRGSSDADTPSSDAQQGGEWNPNATLRGSLLPDPDEPASGGLVPQPDTALIPEPGDEDEQPLPMPAEVQASSETDADTDSDTALGPELESDDTDLASLGDRRGKTAERSAGDDPLADLVASRTPGASSSAASKQRGESSTPIAPAAPTAPAPRSGGDPFVYFVQAGAFRTAQDAEAQRARLSLSGVQARVTQREQAGRTIYRVRVGPFDQRSAADNVLGQLGQGGFDAALVRAQR